MNDYKPEIEKLEGEIREMEELINTAPKEIDTCNEVILEEYNIRLILAQAKLQIWKQALTSEIEFLEKKVYNCKDCIFCNQNKEEDVTRIAELKKELGELK